MNRASFLARLRSGLSKDDVDELVDDYEAHFTEGSAAGRSEEDVSRALGEPGRLARELRAEAGLRRWEAQPSPGNYLGAVFALIGVLAIDFVLLLPFLCVLAAVFFGVGMAFIGIIIGGFAIFGDIASGGGESAADSIALILLSVSLISGGVAGGALILLALEGILKRLSSYARLHYRLLNPGVANA